MAKALTTLAAAVLAAAALAPLPARADFIVGSDDFCQSNGNACLLGGEQKIFLQAQTNTMLGFGNVGG